MVDPVLVRRRAAGRYARRRRHISPAGPFVRIMCATAPTDTGAFSAIVLANPASSLEIVCHHQGSVTTLHGAQLLVPNSLVERPASNAHQLAELLDGVCQLWLLGRR